MKIRVQSPYQVNYDGANHTAGAVLDVPAPLARRWVAAGWAQPDDSDDPASDTSDEDVAEFHVGAGWYDVDGEKVRGETAARKLVRARHKKVSPPEAG